MINVSPEIMVFLQTEDSSLTTLSTFTFQRHCLNLVGEMHRLSSLALLALPMFQLLWRRDSEGGRGREAARERESEREREIYIYIYRKNTESAKERERERDKRVLE